MLRICGSVLKFYQNFKAKNYIALKSKIHNKIYSSILFLKLIVKIRDIYLAKLRLSFRFNYQAR